MILLFFLVFGPLTSPVYGSSQWVTSITTFTTPWVPTSYTVWGQTYNWWTWVDVHLDTFTTASGTFSPSIVADEVLVRRVDNAQVTWERCRLFVELNGDDYTYWPSYPQGAWDNCDIAKIVSWRIINIWALDVFANLETPGKEWNENNIERIDFIFNDGINLSANTTDFQNSGHLVTEKSWNNNMIISPILSLDSNGDPASYGPLTKIWQASQTSEPIRYAITSFSSDNGFLDNEENPPQTWPVFDYSLEESLWMVFVTADDLWLSPWQTYYGFSYMSQDLYDDTQPNNLLAWVDVVDYTTYPTNTSASGDVADADIYGGTAGFFSFNYTITGEVFEDANGNGVEDSETGIGSVRLSLYTDNNNNGIIDGADMVIATTDTAPDGSYMFNAASGNYLIQVDTSDTDIPAWFSLSGTNPLEADVDWANVTDVDFPFSELAVITDELWIDTNGNGIQDAGESWFSGSTVELRDSLGNLVDTTTTDSNWNYVFLGVTPGNYYVEFDLPAWYTFAPSGQGSDSDLDSDVDGTTAATPVQAISWWTVTGANDALIVPIPAWTISDDLWIDTNGNGIQDAGENGFSGSTVELYDSTGTLIDTTTTDANGNYVFSDITPGNYYVEFDLPAWYAFSPSSQGSDPDLDSDVDTSTGRTPIQAIQDGDNISWSNDALITLLAPSWSLEKTTNSTPMEAGDTLDYVFELENTWDTDISAITLTDAKCASAPALDSSTDTNSDSILSPNETWTYTCTSIPVTQTEADDGEVYNFASASGTPTDGTLEDAEDEVTKPIGPTPAIKLYKWVSSVSDNDNDGVVEAWDTVSYEFSIENTWNVTLTNITLTDTSLSGITVSWGPITTLAPNQVDTSTYSATYVLTQADLDAGGIENTASVSGTDPNGTIVEDVSDANTDSNNNEINNPDGTETENPLGENPNDDTDPTEDPTTFIVPPMPAIQLFKWISSIEDTDNNDMVSAGDTVNYEFVVENTGNVTLTNITLSDTSLTGIVLTGDPIASLAPGEIDSTNFSASYVLTQADVDAGWIENTATTSGTDPSGTVVEDTSDTSTDPENNPVNNPPETGGPNDPTEYTIPPMPAIQLFKWISSIEDTDNNDMISAGDTVNYEFVVENTGNVTLTNITLSDTSLTGIVLTGDPIASLAPGEIDSTNFSASYVLTQADVDAGWIENTATTSGTDPSGTVVEDTSDTSTDPENNPVNNPPETGGPSDPTEYTIPPMPRLQLYKTDELFLDQTPRNGSLVDYTFVITNTWNVTVSDITLNDPMFRWDITSSCTFPVNAATGLTPGQTATCEVRYQITQADVDQWYLQNTAITEGTSPQGEEVSDVSDDGNDLEETPDATGGTDTDPTNDPTVLIIPEPPSTGWSGGGWGGGWTSIPPMPEPEENPSMKLYKWVSSVEDTNNDGEIGAWDTVNFEFEIINTWDVVLTDITLSDTSLPWVQVTWETIASLAPGETDTTSYSASYILTQEDMDMGGIENTASVSWKSPDGVIVGDVSDASTSPNNDTENKPETIIEPETIENPDTTGTTEDPTVYIIPSIAEPEVEPELPILPVMPDPIKKETPPMYIPFPNLFKFPKMLPQSGTPLTQRTSIILHPRINITPPKWAKPGMSEDIDYWKNTVLPYSEDRNEDEYIVIPSLWVVVPLKYVPKNTSDYEDIVNDGTQIKDFSLQGWKNYLRYLNEWVMQYPGTLPVGLSAGKWKEYTGNSVIFGHSSYWKENNGKYDTIFGLLPTLDQGEEIWVFTRKNKNLSTSGKKWEYDLRKHTITKTYNTTPDDTQVLSQEGFAVPHLTLFTCTPIWGIAGRWIVQAKLKSSSNKTQNKEKVTQELTKVAEKRLRLVIAKFFSEIDEENKEEAKDKLFERVYQLQKENLDNEAILKKLEYVAKIVVDM